jgi:hypothetical protein
MLGAALAATVLIGLVAVPRALARIASNTIDPAGTIADGGRQVATQGSAAFEAGPATAVAIAVTSVKGEVTDAHQWLVEVMLEE